MITDSSVYVSVIDSTILDNPQQVRYGPFDSYMVAVGALRNNGWREKETGRFFLPGHYFSAEIFQLLPSLDPPDRLPKI